MYEDILQPLQAATQESKANIQAMRQQVGVGLDFLQRPSSFSPEFQLGFHRTLLASALADTLSPTLCNDAMLDCTYALHGARLCSCLSCSCGHSVAAHSVAAGSCAVPLAL